MKSTGKASVLSTMTTMRSLNTTCASHSAFCRATVAGRRKEANCAPPPSRAYRQKWSPSRFRSAKKNMLSTREGSQRCQEAQNHGPKDLL